MKTKKEIDDIIIKKWNTDLTLYEISKLIGKSESSVRRAGARLNLPPRSKVEKDLIQSRRDMYSKQEEKSQTEKAIKKLISENDALKKEIDAVLNTKEIHPKEMTYDKSLSVGEAVAVVLASDWHIEEIVKPQTVNGLNTFNTSIAEKRVQQFFKNTLKLVEKEQNQSDIKTLVLALLGDFISGNIHDELLENCSLRPMEAIILAEQLISGGIDYLLANSKLNLIIPCHVGNHTRITRKVHISTEAGNSIETFMYYHLRNYYKDNPRVVFQISESYLSYLKVFDFTICFQHGHAVRFGGGVGGLSIPLNKAIAQWEKLKHADLYCLGHWHQFLDTGQAIVNGSIIGYNAFALFIKAGFERPKQAFFLIDRKRGCKTIVCPVLFDI